MIDKELEKELIIIKKDLEYTNKNLEKIERENKEEVSKLSTKLDKSLKDFEEKMETNFKKINDKLDNLHEYKVFSKGIVKTIMIITPFIIAIIVAIFKANGVNLT